MVSLSERRESLLHLLSLFYRWKSMRYLLMITILACIILGILFTETGFQSRIVINDDEINTVSTRNEKLKDIIISRISHKLKMDDVAAKLEYAEYLLSQNKFDSNKEALIPRGQEMGDSTAVKDKVINVDIANNKGDNEEINEINMVKINQDRMNEMWKNETLLDYQKAEKSQVKSKENDAADVTKATSDISEVNRNSFPSDLDSNEITAYNNTSNKYLNYISMPVTSHSNSNDNYESLYNNEINITEFPDTKSSPRTSSVGDEAVGEQLPKIEPFDDILKFVQSKTPVNCAPVKNIIFLKTHKTGSSTIINVMQRYAHTHHLKLALPKSTNLLGWPHSFRNRFVFEHSPGNKYNILCNHVRFHKQRMLNVIEDKATTKFITIIRDPLYQFESTAVYLNFAAVFKIDRKKNIFDEFFNKPKMEIYNRTRKRNANAVFLVKNPNAYDLGFPTWREDEKSIERFLTTMKTDFHLVMISDYMAESLVLLKNELCWNLKDVLFFTMNKRPDRLRHMIYNEKKTRRNVKLWNKLDYALFEHYNSTFWKKVRAGGEEFQRDVKRLKQMNEMVRKNCLETGRHYDKSQPWFPILGFKLKKDYKKFQYRELCENMVRSEIDYTNFLKLKSTIYNWTIPTLPPRWKRRKVIKIQQK